MNKQMWVTGNPVPWN